MHLTRKFTMVYTIILVLITIYSIYLNSLKSNSVIIANETNCKLFLQFFGEIDIYTYIDKLNV